jgi:hypothetical protein
VLVIAGLTRDDALLRQPLTEKAIDATNRQPIQANNFLLSNSAPKKKKVLLANKNRDEFTM